MGTRHEARLETLDERIEITIQQLRDYEDRFGVDRPADVADDVDGTVLIKWTSARATLGQYERARQVRLSWTGSSELDG